MLEEIKREIIRTGIKLDRYGLIALSGGNVSVRAPGGWYMSVVTTTRETACC